MSDESDLALFADAYLANAERVPYHAKWVKANPKEVQRWLPFRDAVLAGDSPPAPAMSTRYGRALVAAGEMQIAMRSHIQGIMVPVEEPEDRLTWAPPPLSSPTYANIANTGLACPTLPGQNAGQPWVIDLIAAGGGDFVLTLDHRAESNVGGLAIVGGNNVVIIGGEIEIGSMPDDESYRREAFVFHNQTGTVHVEGVHIYGQPLRPFVLNSSAAVFQIQNCRAEGVLLWGHDFNTAHSDVVLTWQAPAELRIDKFTSDYDVTGFALYENGHTATLKRVNLRNATFPSGHNYLHRNENTVELFLEDFYTETGWGLDGTNLGPFQFTMFVGEGWTGTGGANTTFGDGISTGSYMQFTDPATDKVWSLDNIGGTVTYGIPPGGDYVKEADAGVGYSSPGYLSEPAPPPYTDVDFTTGLYYGKGVSTVFEAWETDARLSTWGGLPAEIYDDPGAFAYSPPDTMSTDTTQRVHIKSVLGRLASWQELRTTDGEWAEGVTTLAKSSLNILAPGATWGPDGFSFGAVRWFAFDILLPLDIDSVSYELSDTWNTLGDMHENSGPNSDPCLVRPYPDYGTHPVYLTHSVSPDTTSIAYYNTQLIQLTDGAGDRIESSYNVWHEVVIGMKAASDGSVGSSSGWCEVWFNGEQKLTQTQMPQFHPSETDPYFQLQNYTSYPTSFQGGATKSAVAYGGFRAGLSRASVQRVYA